MGVEADYDDQDDEADCDDHDVEADYYQDVEADHDDQDVEADYDDQDVEADYYEHDVASLTTRSAPPGRSSKDGTGDGAGRCTLHQRQDGSSENSKPFAERGGVFFRLTGSIF